MSNIGPPNWWLRDKMIELTDKTLDVINKTEEKLNTKINKISETQYITNNTYNTYNNINMTDIIDNGTTNSLRANIVSTSSLRAKTERQSINVTTIPGDNDNIYRISVNKNQPNKLIVSFQKNNNGILVNSNTGLNDIFTGTISFAILSNIVNKYSLHISQTDIIPILPEQNLDNILTIIGDINSSTINSWENSPEGFYIFTLDNSIVNSSNPYFDDNNSSTIILNGTLVFTELVGSIPLVIGNTDEKNIEIKSLHTKLEGNLLDIENNFTNISGNTLNISGNTLNISSNTLNISSNTLNISSSNALDISSSNALSINSMNTNIQGQDINIGTNNVSHNLNIGNQNNNTNMYNILSGNLNTNLLQTNDITVRNILIPVSWKDISTNELLQVKIYNNNKLQLIYLSNSNGVVTYEDSSTILHNKLKAFILEKYSYLGTNFINQNLFSLYDNIYNLDKFAIKIHNITNSYHYPSTKITSVTNVPSGYLGKILELELSDDITSDNLNTYSLPFEAELEFIIQEEHNILNINNSHGKISLQATEGAFNFSGNLTINAGNLTINAGNLTEVVREYLDICSNKIILNGGVTGLTLTPDASIEAQHHEGASSYGTITYSGTDKEWNINPSINSTNHITVGTDLTVNNSATISNTLFVSNATTLNNTLFVSNATTLNNTLFVSNATTLNNSLYVKDATTMEKSLLCNENITGYTGIISKSGLFLNTTVPNSMNSSEAVNYTGFYLNVEKKYDPEVAIPSQQKIIDKDYQTWSGTTKPTDPSTSNNRILTIWLNSSTAPLLLETWDTYHIITRGNEGSLNFRTAYFGNSLQISNKTITAIKVFHNLKSSYAPNMTPKEQGINDYRTYSNDTSSDSCRQISLYSFIQTSTSSSGATINTLYLNINTIDS